jgi:DNA-binding NtrC family response regulator
MKSPGNAASPDRHFGSMGLPRGVKYPGTMTVLMLGQQLELGYYRAAFLESHGFRVIFPENRNAALSAIQAGGFDAAIVSYTLPRETAKELVSLIKQVDKDCPVVAITQERWDENGFEHDETVRDIDRPPALLEALIRIEKRRQAQLQIRRVK